MRLDEFSAPSQIDGTLSTTERTRFLSFGFDVAISEIEPYLDYALSVTESDTYELSVSENDDYELTVTSEGVTIQ